MNTNYINKVVDLENVVELIYSHYKNNGGFTRTAAMFIEKLTGEKWERDEEIAALKKENLELKSLLHSDKNVDEM